MTMFHDSLHRTIESRSDHNFGMIPRQARFAAIYIIMYSMRLVGKSWSEMTVAEYWQIRAVRGRLPHRLTKR
jgi:hypothetical protein